VGCSKLGALHTQWWWVTNNYAACGVWLWEQYYVTLCVIVLIQKEHEWSNCSDCYALAIKTRTSRSSGPIQSRFRAPPSLHFYSVAGFLVPRLVTTSVQSEVIWSGEGAITMLTLERLGSRVFAQVSRQFVWSSKPPLTVLERTLKRLFACTVQQDRHSPVIAPIATTKALFPSPLSRLPSLTLSHLLSHPNSPFKPWSLFITPCFKPTRVGLVRRVL